MKACAKAAGEGFPLVRAPTGRALARRYCYLPGLPILLCLLASRCLVWKFFIYLEIISSSIVKLGMYPSSVIFFFC